MEIGWEVEVLKGAVKDPSPKISQAKALERFSRYRAAQEAALEDNWIYTE
jgi:hypothetical protein